MELARNLKVECVSRLPPAAVISLRPDQTVAEAVSLMRLRRTGCVLVCQESMLVGIFTERDLLRRILVPGLPLETTLDACMTPDPVTVLPGEPVAAAVRYMQEGGYRHLPVTDTAGRAVGIVSVKRIVHYLVEHFPTTIYCLPPDPNNYPQTREGA